MPTGAVTVLSVEPQGQTSPAGTFLRTDADWAEAALTVLGGGMGVGGTETEEGRAIEKEQRVQQLRFRVATRDDRQAPVGAGEG